MSTAPPSFEQFYVDRHQSVREKLRWLQANPRLDGIALDVAREFQLFADGLIGLLNDGPQLSLGLQHLIDAKDCLVRQAIMDVEGVARDEGAPQ